MSLSNAWRARSSHPEGFCKKGVFKTFGKITEQHLCRGPLFNKDSGRGPATLLQRDSIIGVFFVNSAKFLKTLNLETSVNGWKKVKKGTRAASFNVIRVSI